MPLEESATDIEHGWCVTQDGKVIDVTLKEAGLSYFGVPYTFAEMGVVKRLPIVDAIIMEKLLGRASPADGERSRS